jgi:hypothetical protein
MGQRETDIQNRAMAAIQHEHGNHVTMFRVNSGQARSVHSDTRIKLAPKGTADVVLCAYGAYAELEAKTPTGVQSEQQQQRQAAVERAGGIYILFRSPQEAVDLLTAALQRRGLHQAEPREL